MEDNIIINLVDKENEKMLSASNPNEYINILFNLIVVKKNNPNISYETNIYIDIKTLISKYVEVVKTNDYGYDLFNKAKIEKVIGFLDLNEQLSIYKYLFSVISREFPEFEKEWISISIKNVQIDQIIKSKKYLSFFKAIFLYTSIDLYRLFIGLIFFTFIVFIVLLPAPHNGIELFNIKYETYTESFYINHLLNVLSLFGGIESGLKVTALNPTGLIIQIISKVLFILLIVNFIYKKISDQISI